MKERKQDRVIVSLAFFLLFIVLSFMMLLFIGEIQFILRYMVFFLYLFATIPIAMSLRFFYRLIIKVFKPTFTLPHRVALVVRSLLLVVAIVVALYFTYLSFAH